MSNESAEPPRLPPWLTRDLPRKDTDQESDNEGFEFTQTALSWSEPTPDPAPGLMNDLKPLRKARLPRITQVSSVDQSKSILRNLIRQGASMEEAIEFLENPKLNVPAAQNLQYLINLHTESSHASLAEMGDLHRWCFRQIAIGEVPKDELPSLLGMTPRNGLEQSTHTAFESLYKGIFDAIISSDHYDDLHSPRTYTFNAFLRSLPNGALSRPIRNLGVEIIRSLLTSIELPIRARMQRLFQTWFISTRFLDDRANCEGLLIGCAAPLLDMLDHLPRQWLLDMIRANSALFFRSLIAIDPELSVTLRRLENLEASSFLGHFIPNLESYCARRGLSIFAKYLYRKTNREICFCLLRQWYQAKFGHPMVDDLPIHSVLHKRMGRAIDEKPNISPFINLLLTLRSLDYYPTASDQTRLFKLLRALNMHQTSVGLVRCFRMSHVHFDARVVQAEIYHYLSVGKHRLAYKMFQYYHTLPLEHVPELGEIIISRENLDPKAALYYCQRRWRHLGRTREFSQDPRVHKCLRTETLNRLAMAYAKAPHLIPRRSFRMVHACYLILRREHLPLEPDFTRALIHAGVVRYLQEYSWVSTMRFSWILEMVRQVEGSDVAEKLDQLVWTWRGHVLSRQFEEKQAGVRPATTYLERRRATRKGMRLSHAPYFTWWKADGD